MSRLGCAYQSCRTAIMPTTSPKAPSWITSQSNVEMSTGEGYRRKSRSGHSKAAGNLAIVAEGFSIPTRTINSGLTAVATTATWLHPQGAQQRLTAAADGT
jgi:hypothetical protein